MKDTQTDPGVNERIIVPKFTFNPDKDINGNTNGRCADWADEARRIYAIEGGYSPSNLSGVPDVIQDLICDLGHLCDREGLDIEELVKDGIGFWKEER